MLFRSYFVSGQARARRARGFLAFDGMDLTKLCKQFTLADREADVDFVIGILDSDFDHGAHSFHRK